ncbi:MAG: NAD-dependent epimerase/dehydratase family protein [Candidatus Methylacidiphilales bacterium]|nr:NAD(P)-dependent oxidoreductase [Candidatus Methylacidiphilales bacterium]
MRISSSTASSSDPSTSASPLVNGLSPNKRIPQGRIVKRVLVTGAAGYLGRSMCDVLASDYELLRLDIAAVENGSGIDGTDHPNGNGTSISSGKGKTLHGSVTDRSLIDQACGQSDALVLAHMAPNRSEAYDWPDACMDINVKGVALALEAAVRHRIRRVVLISSIAVVWGHVLKKRFLSSDLELFPTDTYGMTKMLQENVARFYHQKHGLEIAMLRPAYVLREDSLVNKYGETSKNVTWQCIDPRDIGRAAHAALQVSELGCESFYLMAGPDAELYADLATPRERLGWVPEHRFEGLPIERI